MNHRYPVLLPKKLLDLHQQLTPKDADPARRCIVNPPYGLDLWGFGA